LGAGLFGLEQTKWSADRRSALGAGGNGRIGNPRSIERGFATRMLQHGLVHAATGEQDARGPFGLCRQDHITGFFGDHDRRRVGVA
jgi:hypothetical protein